MTWDKLIKKYESDMKKIDRKEEKMKELDK